MIFKYLTIEKSINVELDIDVIDAHKLTIIRNANLLPNGSLIHPEPINPDDIQLIPETASETQAYNKILDGVGSSNYYYDADLDLFLSQSIKEIVFYIDGTNRRNQYLYQVPGITSNTIPSLIFNESVLTRIEFYNTSIITGTNIISLMDNDTGLSLYSFNVTNASELVIDAPNVIINSNSRLSAYIGTTGINNPVFKAYVREIYNA